MYQEPSSYWEHFRKGKRFEENWLIRFADLTVWVGCWLTGAACLAGLTSIAFSS